MRKTEVIQIRVTKVEKARIRREARQAGQRMSEWMLARLLKVKR